MTALDTTALRKLARAEFDPPTIVALLDEVDDLRAQRDRWRADWEDADARRITAENDRDDLRATVARVEALADMARRAVEQTETTCRCPDEPHQNLLHDIAHDVRATLDGAP